MGAEKRPRPRGWLDLGNLRLNGDGREKCFCTSEAVGVGVGVVAG